MTLGYSKEFPWGEPTNFKEKILADEKIHSIREDLNDRWPPSTGVIHHVYGNRSKERECFRTTPCVSTQKILIIRTSLVGVDKKGNDIVVGNSQTVIVDGRTMNEEQVKLIAKNDGFASAQDFFRWFSRDFSGKIIHWTKLRY